jgi:hypothetical protein
VEALSDFSPNMSQAGLVHREVLDRVETASHAEWTRVPEVNAMLDSTDQLGDIMLVGICG